MRPKRFTLTPQSDADGICASQTPAAAGNLTIAGALASGGAVSLNHGHLITITSDGNDSGRTFTLTGTDYRGVALTEAVTGPNTTTVSSAKYFKTITQVAVDDATAGAITVGVNGVSASDWYLTDRNIDPFNIGFGVDISGTCTYTVQHTFEDMQVADISAVKAFDHASVASKTADANDNYAYPCSAMRVIISAFTSGTLKLQIIQAG